MQKLSLVQVWFFAIFFGNDMNFQPYTNEYFSTVESWNKSIRSKNKNVAQGLRDMFSKIFSWSTKSPNIYATFFVQIHNKILAHVNLNRLLKIKSLSKQTFWRFDTKCILKWEKIHRKLYFSLRIWHQNIKSSRKGKD